MDIRRILVPLSGRHAPLDPDDLDAPALTAALALAAELAAEVQVLSITQPATAEGSAWSSWLPGHGIDPLLDQFDRLDKIRRNQAEAGYRRLAAKAPGVRSAFVEHVGDIRETIGDFGRMADLVVVASSLARWETPFRPILEASLRRTARPVLATPAAAPVGVGRKICIGWNNSIESARAVAGAMPFLKRADETVILACAEGDSPVDPRAEALAEYLALHGVTARVEHLAEGEAHASEVVLGAAEAMDADLIVLGTVIHHRAYSLLFGSLTEAVLRSPRIPALLVP